MKNRKNIALIGCLLLWAVLLCFSGYLKAEQVIRSSHSYSLNTSPVQLNAEEPSLPVAWSEPSAPHQATTATDPVLPLLLFVYRALLRLLPLVGLKLTKAILGFSSLTEQFRILPNAP